MVPRRRRLGRGGRRRPAAGPDTNNNTCSLARFPAAVGERVYFFSFVAADLFHMLAHALRYYKHLGVDFRRRARFVVHNASGAVPLAKTLAYLDRYGAAYAVRSDWSSALKRDLANAYLATLPTDALLVYPDLDEFFAYPCDLSALVAARRAISGLMSDRVAFDWRLARLAALPGGARVTRQHAIDFQFPRKCALTAGLFGTNAHKFTLVPAADAAGGRLAYVNAHSVRCGGGADRGARALKSKNKQSAAGCVGVDIHRGPDVAHYGFTRVTVPMLERKLETYRAIHAEKQNPASLDAVRGGARAPPRSAAARPSPAQVKHYERLRENFAWCPRTRSFQFTAAARRRAEATYCEPLPAGAAADYPAPDLCPEPPTPAPTPAPSPQGPTPVPSSRAPSARRGRR